MASVQYPLNGPGFSYTYDEMGWPKKLTDNQEPPVDWVSNASYGPAGELTGMSGAGFGEGRTYNALGQLTRLTASGYWFGWVNFDWNTATRRPRTTGGSRR